MNNALPDSDHNTAHNPHLPRMIMTPHGYAPKAPLNVQATDIDRMSLVGLVLMAAQGVPHFTLEWASRRLALPQSVIADLAEELRNDSLLEVRGQNENGGYRYAISQRGREQADRFRDICGYIGPAPVSLEVYGAMLQWQLANSPQINPQQVEEALSGLTLDKYIKEIAGLAVSSKRSMFLSGPPGNGKTSLGRQLHRVFTDDIWIPHCIAADNNIIRLFDTHCHEVVPTAPESAHLIDQRWVRIRRPLIVAGGEMTLQSLDLAYHEALRCYEAPLHMKANGGTFLIDDFGRQRLAPEDLLNRWIIPLEHGIDFLTLHSGQKIEVPFLLMLIIATNLNPEDVTDPAFLRRLGYRVSIAAPSDEQYKIIFNSYAARYNLTVEPSLIEMLINRYKETAKELRSCEPRDLIERTLDICRHRGEKERIDQELLNLAWRGYFGT